MSRTFLVTGVAGFIGSHVGEALVGRGDRVVGVDNFCDFYDPAVKRANLAALARHERFTLCEGDIRDPAAMQRAFAVAPIDCVMHLAAMAGVAPSLEQPALYQDVNVRGTLAVLEAARARRVPRFVFASSSSVYGRTSRLPFAEDDPADRPVSPYAATKRAGELLAHVYHDLYAMQVTCLRFFTVYGPRQRPDLAVHKFTRLIEAGRPITVFGDGRSSRDYTYVDDILDGVLKALDRVAAPPSAFAVYNLGESRPVTLLELIELLGAALGKRPTIDWQPDRPATCR
ncbi:MAG: NAD-dependent epimerase/dehydratase family protein [Planctomycetota bacterium]